MANDVERLVSGKCRVCGGTMQPGQALQDVYGGIPDFPGGAVMTMSPTGNAVMVSCIKCETCGHSLTANA